ncbi:MAG: FAD-dependent oxidoreductase [Propionibacteriaceae bacterium]
MSRPRYVVVGAGLAGSATAWQLARRGCDVTVVEAFRLAHDRGSSHGSARIIRRAYPDRFHAALTGEAWRDWGELEAETGKQIITRTGGVDFGLARNVPAIARAQADEGIPHTVYRAAEARERWPQFAFDTDVLFHPDAGVVDADLAVLTAAHRAEQLGAVVHQDWPVAAVEEQAGGYVVSSAAGQPAIEADVVVVTAGPWLPELLTSLPVDPEAFPTFEVTQQQIFHFASRDDSGWPIFVHKDALSVYGLPGGRDVVPGMIKVAEHDGGGVTTASERDGRVDPRARERIADYVDRYLPGLVPEPSDEATCLYTSTPTENFLIDRVDGLVIVSPCSGHGAKFAPTVGRLAADLATGAREQTLAPFSFAAHDPVVV